MDVHRAPALFALVVLAAATAASATPAWAAALRPRNTSSPLVGTPASPVVIDRDAGGTLESRDASGHRRVYAQAQLDAYPLAVAPGSAFVATREFQAELDLKSGRLTPLAFGAMPHGGSLQIQRAGRRWLEVQEATPSAYYTVFIDRLTGRMVSSDDLGARQAPDLDGDITPAQPLCGGVRRFRMPGASADGLADHYGRVFASGRWVLVQTSPARNTANSQLRRWQVQRCGSGAVALRFTARGTPALSAGRLAWANGRGVHLRRLAAARTTRLALAELTPGSIQVAFSADALLVSSGGDTPAEEFTTYRIRLH